MYHQYKVIPETLIPEADRLIQDQAILFYPISSGAIFKLEGVMEVSSQPADDLADCTQLLRSFIDR